MINVAGGHMGRDKTYEKVASRFYWDALDRDVREYVQHCDVCQRTNDACHQEVRRCCCVMTRGLMIN